jgi:thymidylate kinase
MKLKTRFICFIGVDGSGKSTLAEMLCNDLRENGYEVSYLWLRMNYLFTKPLLLLCRLLGLTQRPVINGKKISIHEFHTSPFMAAAVRLAHTFDTFLHYTVKIWVPLKFSKKVIVCDRFIYDVFIDFAIEGNTKSVFSKPLFKLAHKMTDNALLLLIMAPKDEILKRKPDVLQFDLSYNERYDFYNEIAKQKDVHIIENTQPVDLVYKKIKDEVTV